MHLVHKPLTFAQDIMTISYKWISIFTRHTKYVHMTDVYAADKSWLHKQWQMVDSGVRKNVKKTDVSEKINI